MEKTLNNTIGVSYLGSVIASIVLDTVHLAVTTHAVYHYVVSAFGNFAALQHIVCPAAFDTSAHRASAPRLIAGRSNLYALRVWKLLAAKVYTISAFIELGKVAVSRRASINIQMAE
ncbi:hypothetical protein CVT26_005777 [Gymnopilus dilepis]|uniref:Uncharacterized protein n=1 Tax=Gymnopilus dilepis TaxID=231916 RepID=A0A409VPG2_9AGAR|nr:hypothetical protein CVT26_005777 [Gymnopilus dilepis]